MSRVAKLFAVAILQATVLLTVSTAFAANGKKSTIVTIPPAPGLYAAEPQPLATNQCAQCHPGPFGSLKSDGGRHQFDCQKCHTKFHAYNPRKGNWDAIMPKCASCHSEPHGKTITDCASCHSNPHAPKKIGMDAALINACPTCHAGPREQLAKFPSKHSKVACQKCHTTHGYKPSCFNCHKPHTEGQELASCTKCHQVHQPLQVFYGKDAPASTCGSCHGKVYAKWQKTTSKHGKVNCATCHHTKHKTIPKCQDCHGTPHTKEFHAKFPNCLSCHVDVHDLPVKGKQKQ